MNEEYFLFSVVICTYNRAHLLPTVLQTVCEQALDCAEYEVLVVDNNSTDETRFVTEAFMQRYENVRYCSFRHLYLLGPLYEQYQHVTRA